MSRRSVIRARLGAAALGTPRPGPMAIPARRSLEADRLRPRAGLESTEWAGTRMQEAVYPRPEGDGGWQRSLDTATQRYERKDGATPSPYGYTFWVMDRIEGVPGDLFMSRGHNINHSFVIPSLDLVVVRQANDNRRMVGDARFMDRLIQQILAAAD